METDKKKDNSYFEHKVALREAFLPGSPACVLDAFAGKGKIWKAIKRKNDVAIYTGIERERGKNPLAIMGDNLKVLPKIDLSIYNVIDLDSYGVPVDQLLAIFNNSTLKRGTVVFVTCIFALMGVLPHKLAPYVNTSPEMVKKCPSLFASKAWEAVQALLYNHGVSDVYYYEFEKGGMKYYYAAFEY